MADNEKHPESAPRSDEAPTPKPAPSAPEDAPPAIVVAPSPHLHDPHFTTRRMMFDVIVALVPVILVSVVVFGWAALAQLSICVLSCLVFEALFGRLMGKPLSIGDGSAAVTGLILGLSLPWTAPVYVGVIGSGVAIGLGKVVFGGLGFNLFNPAMVGRAFVMLSFAAAMGAGAYVAVDGLDPILTQATPLDLAKQSADGLMGFPDLWLLFVGTHNGSLGETSVLASLIGGLYLILRRSAAWEIPLGVVAATIVCAGLFGMAGLTPLTAWQHLAGGAVVFGAFFIATDPVTSPVAPWGRFCFGAGIGALVIILRVLSGYPEGLMFAVLLMNALVPLLNRWTIPRPVGGHAAQRA